MNKPQKVRWLRRIFWGFFDHFEEIEILFTKLRGNFIGSSFTNKMMFNNYFGALFVFLVGCIVGLTL